MAQAGGRARPDGVVTDWADSGVMALTGHPDRPPLLPPGRAASLARELGERLAELTSAAGREVRVDGAALLGERAALTGRRRQGRTSVGGATRLLPTATGWGAVTLAREDDLALAGALVGEELPADPWPALARWLLEHSDEELAEGAALLGLPAAPVHPPPQSPVLPVPAEPRDVRDLLVVDFSALWAGPLGTSLLALAGARVVKVETPHRLDGARRGHPGFYDLLHAGTRSVVLDPAEPAGRAALHALVDRADVVVEASRPRALAGLGLDAEAAVASGTTWVSITAAGRASARVGFGDDVAAGAGLVAHDHAGSPVFVGDALADPLTGLAAATLALTAPPNGSGVLWDVAMADVVASTLPLDASSVPGATAQAGGPVAVPLAPPRARAVPPPAPGPGVDTRAVLEELGIPLP